MALNLILRCKFSQNLPTNDSLKKDPVKLQVPENCILPGFFKILPPRRHSLGQRDRKGCGILSFSPSLYIQTYIHTHIHIHIHIHVHIHIHTHTHTHIRIHIHIHIHIHIRISASQTRGFPTYTIIYCTCIHIYIYMYKHSHRYTHTCIILNNISTYIEGPSPSRGEEGVTTRHRAIYKYIFIYIYVHIF